MKSLFPAVAALFIALSAHASSRTEVFSPDGRISVTIQDGAYCLTVDGRAAMSSSIAELKLSDGRTFGTSAKARRTRLSRSPKKELISSPFYRQESFIFEYNSLTLDFGKGWGMEWIVSDQGAAYRFFGGEPGVSTTVTDETASFVFNDDCELTMAYSTNKKKPYAMAFQNTYKTERLSKADATIPAFRPYGSSNRRTLLRTKPIHACLRYTDVSRGQALHGKSESHRSKANRQKGMAIRQNDIQTHIGSISHG